MLVYGVNWQLVTGLPEFFLDAWTFHDEINYEQSHFFIVAIIYEFAAGQGVGRN